MSEPTTTGEWTARTVQELGLYGNGNTAIANAHNAALAAESEVWRRQATEIIESLAAERERELQQQLAAEQHWLGELLAVIHGDGGHYQSEHGTEKATKDAIAVRTGMVLRIDELEAQLAAERLKCDTAIENCMIHRRIATELREQLAAEREIGGNTAIALAQQITKLEDQLAAEREKVKELEERLNVRQ